MKKKEKQLVILAGVLFAAVLVFRVVPMALNHYQAGQDEIARIENRIDNYRRLIEETGRWIEREEARRAEVEQLADWVFVGSNVNLIVTNVQQELRRAANEAGIVVRETALPDYAEVDEWLMVSQEISFLLERQSDMIVLLDLLENSRPHLFVTEFRISQSRRQYVGSLVVTGFGKTRLPELSASALP